MLERQAKSSMSPTEPPPISPERFEQICEALWGPLWLTAVRREVGVSRTHVERIRKGEQRLSPRLRRLLAQSAEKRLVLIREALLELGIER